jgi:hypothetical protein
MKTDKELIQMALDALESCLEDENHDGETFEYFDWRKVEAAKKAMRDRLAQPEREWIGLTDADKSWAFDETQEGGGFWEFADAIEAILKERNFD